MSLFVRKVRVEELRGVHDNFSAVRLGVGMAHLIEGILLAAPKVAPEGVRYKKILDGVLVLL